MGTTLTGEPAIFLTVRSQFIDGDHRDSPLQRETLHRRTAEHVSGPEFLSWRAGTDDWLGTVFSSFWRG